MAVVNQKGGVGKTTTAVNLAACLAVAEEPTLLVDLDPQSNATSAFGIYSSGPALYRALVLRESLPDDSLQNIDIKGLKLLPSSIDLAGAEVELADLPDRAGRLREALAPLKRRFRFILIDCPPSLGFLTLNGLRAADEVLIPLQAEYFALEGLARLMKTVERIRGSLHPGLRVGGIVLTMYDVRTNLSRQVGEELRSHMPNLVYRVAIPRSVRLAEAPSHGKPVISYDISSPGAQAYLALAGEFLARCGRKPRG
ncbi:MAG: ParA family protein [Nitrospinota bacterium]